MGEDQKRDFARATASLQATQLPLLRSIAALVLSDLPRGKAVMADDVAELITKLAESNERLHEIAAAALFVAMRDIVADGSWVNLPIAFVSVDTVGADGKPAPIDLVLVAEDEPNKRVN